MALRLNFKGINDFLNWEESIKKIQPKVKSIHKKLHEESELEKEYLGWLKLPLLNSEKKKEIEKIKQLKKKKQDLNVLVVIGIGGSYLGTKSGIDFLQNPFVSKKTEIIFAGNNVSGNYLTNLIKYLKNKKWAINIISKSGTTLEPALTFRILKKELEEQYGKEKARENIFVTTDSNKGLLLSIAKKEGYERFVIPDSVGGRYSVLTAVGLLPFVFADLDIDSMLKGSYVAYQDTLSEYIQENPAYQYAVARYLIHTQLHKKVELIVSYEPHLCSFGEWWKQLFAESEGKENKGLFVSSMNNSTDLHSLGQFVQEGSKILFETILNITIKKDDCLVPKINNDLDNLNYLSGKTFSEINQKILQATKQAHIEGQVPNLEIIINNLDAYHFGYLVFFFEKACSMSGYLLGINPFNQPGVEIYKKRMFSLLSS
ncbi:glucose-6-phosphate isomerase [Candidatus Phytoplasma pini]|uniref:Glucose-6-phosphate isomerase n=1 Tax=Candidatus Phytoplasma pini TaxID=267362 RepID=A0A559KJ71_9MOLU|nr:glucose-6-phosphate isomerase [Candidatus Phytoplasma pini]TVY12183.1 glucose-6-phosphate isomerase [Candidatus Phytoplasma pini]